MIRFVLVQIMAGQMFVTVGQLLFTMRRLTLLGSPSPAATSLGTVHLGQRFFNDKNIFMPKSALVLKRLGRREQHLSYLSYLSKLTCLSVQCDLCSPFSVCAIRVILQFFLIQFLLCKNILSCNIQVDSLIHINGANNCGESGEFDVAR